MSKKDDLEALEQQQKKSQENAAGNERWLISYADFVTLLLAFFIVMFAVSQVNKAKVEGFEKSMRMAFGGKPPVTRTTPPQADEPFHHLPSPVPLVAVPPAVAQAIREQEQVMAHMRVQLRRALAPLIRKGVIHVVKTPTGTKIRINANVLFRSGSARLQPRALRTVDVVGLVLKKFPYHIAIEGFTNRIPIRTRKYPSNWYLSSARSLSVLARFLLDGVRPDLLKAVGFGATHPAVPYTPEHIQNALRENRRVTIFVEGDTRVIMTQIARMIR